MTYRRTEVEKLAQRRTQGSVGVLWRLLVFSASLLGLTILAYVGIAFGYKAYLNNKIENIKAEKQIIESEITTGEIDDMIGFYSRLYNIKSLLVNHRYPSRFIKLIEQTSVQNIRLTSIEVETTAQGDGQVSIVGEVGSLFDLSAQLEAWERSDFIEEVVLKNAQSDKGRAGFEVEMVVDKEVFKFSS